MNALQVPLYRCVYDARQVIEYGAMNPTIAVLFAKAYGFQAFWIQEIEQISSVGHFIVNPRASCFKPEGLELLAQGKAVLDPNQVKIIRVHRLR